MAHVAMGSLHVTGAVAGMSIIEGRAIVLGASGIHMDLPTANLAPSGSKNVFVAICPPDMLPRPTPASYFQYNPVTTTPFAAVEASGYITWDSSIDINMVAGAVEYLIESGQSYNGDQAQYLVGPSMWQEPVIASGWKVQCHRGGAYTLTANAFVDSAPIRVPGATVEVGSNGRFQHHTGNGIVGYVREYRDGKLTIVLDSRSA